MAQSVTWYLTDVTRTGGSGDWTVNGPSTQVDVWFGTQAEWNALTPTEQGAYDIHVVSVDSLVDAAEAKASFSAYSSTNSLGYTFPNNSGFLGTNTIDINGNAPGGIEPSVALAVDGGSIQSSNHAIVITLDPITAATIGDGYQPGQGNFSPFRPGKLTPPCLTRGTLVRTPGGPVAVEALRVGDLVATADHGARPVAMICSTKIAAAGLSAAPELRPIRIRAGALGDGLPTADLVVSPQHRMLVRSKIAQRMFGALEVLVAAKQLLAIDGVEIDQIGQEVEYFHILFEEHEVIFANDAPTESLFTGPEAIKALSPAARAEVFSIFPELVEDDTTMLPARLLVQGRRGRQLANRHANRSSELLM